MSIFRNKILTKVIAMLCICLTIMNFGMSNSVHAVSAEWGGVLLTPITVLLTSIADGIIGLLHKVVQHQDVTLIQIAGTPNWWNDWGKEALKWTIVVVIIIVAVAATIYTAGAAAGGIAAAVSAGAKAFIIPAVKVGLAVGGIEVLSFTLTGQEAATFTASILAERIGNWFSDTLFMPVFTLTPKEIFSNKIALLDINFFNPMPDEERVIETNGGSGQTTETKIIKSTASQLKDVISKWYFILRNLALLVLMLLLIYSGIRIVIGSTSGQKAKYKERLKDWLVAMCLVFIMHYIMAFAIQLVEKINELLVNLGDVQRNDRIHTVRAATYKLLRKE